MSLSLYNVAVLAWAIIGLVSYTDGEVSCPSLAANINFNISATYWCGIETSVLLYESCATAVEEVITIPWSTKVFTRIIPHQSSQQIQDLTAKFGLPTSANPMVSAPTRQSERILNTTIQVRTPAQQNAMRVSLRYNIFPGTVKFKPCNLSTTTFGDSNASIPASDSKWPVRIMLTRWAMGGLSVSRLHWFSVRFTKPVANEAGIVDITMPDSTGFDTKDGTSIMSSRDMSFISISGNCSERYPSDMVAYARTWARREFEPCSMPRDCEAERTLTEEGKPTRFPIGVIVVCAVIGFLMIGALVVWLWWCRHIRLLEEEHDRVDDQDGGSDTGMPVSLRHFAYDTGDDTQTWKPWSDMQDSAPKDVSPTSGDDSPL